jgi:hypothetical protein
MVYRLEWRLLGRENRLLDSGEIDNGFRDRQAALQALGAFLLQFPVWGRDTEAGGWWARRSADADLKVQISLREQVPSAEDMVPAMWAARPSKRASLRA